MTTTATAGERLTPAASAMTAKRRALALHSGRFKTWKTVLIQSLGRELHALHIQQQERAFLATTHGLTYASGRSETTAVH